MDLEELGALLAVAETGSFLAAATSIGLSRSTLRRRVGALEARIGVPLLDAHHRGVVLTQSGAALVEEGRRLRREMTAVLGAIRDSAQSMDSTLRVALPVGLPPHLLTPLFASFRAALPKLRLHCRFSEAPLAEPLEDVDVAVHFGPDSLGSLWESRVVLRLVERLVASPDYLDQRGTPRTVDDLADHDLLVWLAPGASASTLPIRDGAEVAVRPRMVATDIHLLRQLCIAGLGIAYLVDADLPDPGVARPLAAVLADRVGREQTLRLAVPRVLIETPKIRLILDHLRVFLDAAAPR